MKNIKLTSKIVVLFLLLLITSCDKKAVSDVIDVLKEGFGLESITLDGKVVSTDSELEVDGGKRHSVKFKFSENIDFKEDIYTIKEIDSKGNEKEATFSWRMFNPEEPKTAEVKFDALYGKKYKIVAEGEVQFAKQEKKYKISKTVNLKSSDVVTIEYDGTDTNDGTETLGGDGTPTVTISQPAPSRGVLVIEADYNQIGRSTAVYKSDDKLISVKGFEMTVNVDGTEIVNETYDRFANNIKLMKSEGGLFSIKINLDNMYNNQLEIYKKMIEGNTSVTFKAYDEPTGGRLLANITKEFNIEDVGYKYTYKPQNLDEAMNQLVFGTDYYFYLPDFSKDNREYTMKYRVGEYSGYYASGPDSKIDPGGGIRPELYSSAVPSFSGVSQNKNDYSASKMVQNFKFVKIGTVKASDLNLSDDLQKRLKITDVDYPVYNISYTRGSHQVWIGNVDTSSLGTSSDKQKSENGQYLVYFHQGNTNRYAKKSKVLLIPIGNGKFYMLTKDFNGLDKYRIAYLEEKTSSSYFGLLSTTELTTANLDRIVSLSDAQNLEVSFPERLKWIKRYVGTKQGAIVGVPPMRILSAFDVDASNCAADVKVTNTVGITETRTTTTTTTEEKSFSLANTSTLSTSDSRTTSTTEDHTASVSVTASAGFSAFGAEVSVEVSTGYDYTNSRTQEFTSDTGKENTSERSSDNSKGREDSTEKSVEISKEISIEVEAKTTLRARTLYYQAQNVKLPVEHLYQFSAINIHGKYISGQDLLLQLQQSPGWTGTFTEMMDTSITVTIPGTITVDNIYYSKFTSSTSGKCPE